MKMSGPWPHQRHTHGDPLSSPSVSRGPYCWLLLVGTLLGRLSRNQAAPKEMKMGSVVLQAPPEGSYRVMWDLQ